MIKMSVDKTEERALFKNIISKCTKKEGREKQPKKPQS
jgi:hypothetical protein